jgi:hypothetical protein
MGGDMMRNETSRRRFLKATVLGAASAAGSLIEAAPAREVVSEPETRRLERLAERYGSELGELRKVGR